MAATIANELIQDFPNFMQQSTLSTLVTGDSFTIDLLGPSGRAPYKVDFMVTTKPTSGDDVRMTWQSSSTSANTITVFSDSEGGGSLDGAVVKAIIEWHGVASGGIS